MINTFQEIELEIIPTRDNVQAKINYNLEKESKIFEQLETKSKKLQNNTKIFKKKTKKIKKKTRFNNICNNIILCTIVIVIVIIIAAIIAVI